MVQLKTLNDIPGLIVKNRTGLLRMQSPAQRWVDYIVNVIDYDYDYFEFL